MMQDFYPVTQPLWKVWVMFSVPTQYKPLTLRWRRNERDGVSNHQPHHCLLNRIFSHRWKKISKLRFTGLCEGNSPVAGNSQHEGPVTRKCFHLMTSSCCAGIIPVMGSVKERGCYTVMPPLIGWAHSQNDPCCVIHLLLLPTDRQRETPLSLRWKCTFTLLFAFISKLDLLIEYHDS